MNLFVCDTTVDAIARSLADRHIVKMGLEAAQLLCTATRSGPYKPTHANTPLPHWVGASSENARWTKDYALALCAEYTFRYDKVHRSEAVLRDLDLSGIPTGPRTPFRYIGLPAFADQPSTLEAYRALLAYKYAAWGKAARWTRRPRPAWLGPNLHDNRENLP